jgi:hypothetical protein
VKLLDLCRTLEPTGYGGLEGLVTCALGAHFNLNIRIAAAGNQHGRDGGLYNPDNSWSGIDIEGKRYGPRTRLNQNELLGKITTAKNQRAGLRVWILACTRPIPSDLAESLINHGLEISVDVIPLDGRKDGGGPLISLLAAESGAVLGAVDKVDSQIG